MCKVSHNYRPYVTIPLLVVIDTNWLQPGETSATKHYGILKNKAIEVRPGAAKTAFSVERPAALSNKGGIINILDETGLKVDGVSYTKAQASNQVGPVLHEKCFLQLFASALRSQSRIPTKVFS